MAACLWAIGLPTAVAAAPPDDRAGPELSWTVAGGDASIRIDVHEFNPRETEGQPACEHLRVNAGAGTHVYATHPIDRARVIDELTPRVWIRSDRSNLQILARVVLPRTLDPKTDEPVRVLVRGTYYTQVSQWQQLQVVGIPTLLARQVRVLRLQLGPEVDAREAFVDLVCLNIYGGNGTTNVWVARPHVDGFVEASGTSSTDRSTAPASVDAGSGSHDSATPNGTGPISGTVLRVAGRPFFPRAIRYSGEPIEVLARLGFNTVRFDAPVDPALLREVERHRLRAICPPPRVDEGRPIDASYDCVLAWDFGRGLSGRELEEVAEHAAAVRRADGVARRPVLCGADSHLYAYSRAADVLLLDRSPAGTSLDAADFVEWLAQWPRLARPGTPHWATVQTEPAESLVRQMAAFSSTDRRATLALEAGQIRLLAHAALASGARGICCDSRSRLDAGDPATRLRAATLESLNLELDAIEAWAAAGSVQATVASTDPEVRVAVLATERARLLLPLRTPQSAQLVMGAADTRPLSLVVPNVPDDNRAYLLTIAGLSPLRQERRPGGLRITLEGNRPAAIVVLTQDPLVISGLARKLAATRKRAAGAHREIAALSLDAARQVERETAGRLDPQTTLAQSLDEAEAGLRQCDALLAAGDYAGARVASDRAVRAVSRVRYAHWQKATEQFPSPVASPFCTQFATLPLHYAMADRLQGSRLGENELSGGDFEDLQRMVDAGWRHLQLAPGGVKTHVELSPDDRHSGRFSLRMSAWREQEDAEDGLVETTPVWVTGPRVAVSPGRIVRIHGFVKTRQPLAGSFDGVMVIDSLGGPALAHRVRPGPDWQEFTLYRATGAADHLTVTLALTGLGSARFDDVTVTPLEVNAPMAAAGPGTARQTTGRRR